MVLAIDNDATLACHRRVGDRNLRVGKRDWSRGRKECLHWAADLGV